MRRVCRSAMPSSDKSLNDSDDNCFSKVLKRRPTTKLESPRQKLKRSRKLKPSQSAIPSTTNQSKTHDDRMNMQEEIAAEAPTQDAEEVSHFFSWKSKEPMENPLKCPLCAKAFENKSSHISHLKQCAKKKKVPTSELLRMMEGKVGNGKPKPAETPDDDESSFNVALAVAMSISSLEESTKNAPSTSSYQIADCGVIEAQKATLEKYGFTSSSSIATGKAKRRKLINRNCVLRTRTEDDRMKLLTEKAAVIILSDEYTKVNSEAKIIPDKLLEFQLEEPKLWQIGAEMDENTWYVEKLKNHIAEKSDVGRASLDSASTIDMHWDDRSDATVEDSENDDLIHLTEFESCILREDWRKMINKTDHSDITLQTADGQLHAHSLVFHARCPQFLNSDYETIFSDTSSAIALIVLEYIYTGMLTKLLKSQLDKVVDASELVKCVELSELLKKLKRDFETVVPIPRKMSEGELCESDTIRMGETEERSRHTEVSRIVNVSDVAASIREFDEEQSVRTCFSANLHDADTVAASNAEPPIIPQISDRTMTTNLDDADTLPVCSAVVHILHRENENIDSADTVPTSDTEDRWHRLSDNDLDDADTVPTSDAEVEILPSIKIKSARMVDLTLSDSSDGDTRRNDRPFWIPSTSEDQEERDMIESSQQLVEHMQEMDKIEKMMKEHDEENKSFEEVEQKELQESQKEREKIKIFEEKDLFEDDDGLIDVIIEEDVVDPRRDEIVLSSDSDRDHVVDRNDNNTEISADAKVEEKTDVSFYEPPQYDDYLDYYMPEENFSDAPLSQSLIVMSKSPDRRKSVLGKLKQDFKVELTVVPGDDSDDCQFISPVKNESIDNAEGAEVASFSKKPENLDESAAPPDDSCSKRISDNVSSNSSIAPPLSTSIIAGLEETWEDKTTPKATSSSIVEITPKATPSLKFVNRVTPRPRYSIMKSGSLKKHLQRYGLKKSLGKLKARKILGHIYDELHPMVNTKTGKIVRILPDPKPLKNRKTASQRGKNSRTATKSAQTFSSQVSTSSISMADSGNFTSSSQPNPSTAKSDSVDNSSSSENESMVGEDDALVFSDDEILTQSEASKLPVEGALMKFIREHPHYQRQIVLFKPIWIEEFKEEFQKFHNGAKYKSREIVKFLEDRCITYRSANQAVNNLKRNQRRQKIQQMKKVKIGRNVGPQ